MVSPTNSTPSSQETSSRSVRSPAAGSVAVIVNADDFGMNQPETEAVCEGLAKGRINSATVMANGAALPVALRNIHAFRGCSFGVHLNLTQGVPVMGGAGAKLLVNENGGMSRQAFSALRPTPAVLRAAYAEWCAQVDLLARSGLAVSHFDSHNHIHTVPFLFPVLKAVQKRFGIRKVRISKNIYAASDPCGTRLKLKKAGFNFALRTLYRTRTTSGFTDLTTFCEVAGQGGLRHRTVEVMVHPKSMGAEREDVLLSSDWESSLPFPVVKIHYGQL